MLKPEILMSFVWDPCVFSCAEYLKYKISDRFATIFTNLTYIYRKCKYSYIFWKYFGNLIISCRFDLFKFDVNFEYLYYASLSNLQFSFSVVRQRGLVCRIPCQTYNSNFQSLAKWDYSRMNCPILIFAG